MSPPTCEEAPRLLTIPGLRYSQRVRLVFSALDSRSRGFICADEFCRNPSVFEPLGVAIKSTPSAYDFFGVLDADGKGRIDFGQFLAQFAKHERFATLVPHHQRGKFLREPRVLVTFESALMIVDSVAAHKTRKCAMPYQWLQKDKLFRGCSANLKPTYAALKSSLIMSTLRSLHACAATSLHNLGEPILSAVVHAPHTAKRLVCNEGTFDFKGLLCHKQSKSWLETNKCPTSARFNQGHRRSHKKKNEPHGICFELYHTRLSKDYIDNEASLLQLEVMRDAHSASHRTHRLLGQRMNLDNLVAIGKKNSAIEAIRMHQQYVATQIFLLARYFSCAQGHQHIRKANGVDMPNEKTCSS